MYEKLRIRAILSCSLITFFAATAMTCASKTQAPKIDIYQGDHKNMRITRGAERSFVDCKEKSFDDYVCVNHRHYEYLVKACLEAKRPWFHFGQ